MNLTFWFRKNWPFLLILFLLIVITYGNAFLNEFISDDLAQIQNNPDIGNIKTIFTNPFGSIRLILYWFVYHSFGLIPFGFRLINFFFHTGNVLLIFIILTILKVSKKRAFLIAAIFAVHPAISEAVVWISGGNYSQYSFFFLLSFLCYVLPTKQKLFYLLSAIFYLLSLMSNPQMPLPLFLAFPLYEAIFGNLKKNWLKSLPYLAIALMYLGVNLASISERETTLKILHYQQKGMDNPVFVLITAISSYLELIFFPKALTFYHTEIDFSKLELILRFLSFLGYLSLTLLAFFKSKKLFFCLIFFLIALSPTLTPFRLNWIVAERYLYLPILGIIIPTVFILDKVLSRFKIKNLSLIVLSLIVVLLGMRTFIRNMDWQNGDTLWLATDKVSPSSPANHNNLGDLYFRRNDYKKSIEEFQKAVSLKPDYGDAYYNMGNSYKALGQIDKALQSYQKALSFNPNIWPAYQNIAFIYFLDKKYDLAEENIKKAIKLQPQRMELVYNLGLIYLNTGEKTKAKQFFESILQQDPQNQVVQQALMKASQ